MICAAGVMASCANSYKESGSDSVFFNDNNGPITEKTYEGNIDEIKVATSIKAEVLKADTEKVVVSAPEEIMKYIKVDLSGGTLYIRVSGNIGRTTSTRNVKAVIYVKDFNVLRASSSASVKVKDAFQLNKLMVDVSSSASVQTEDLQARDFKIEATSSADFSGRVASENLLAEANSSGSISLSGKAVRGALEASSSGSIDAEGLTVENANLKANSSGTLRVGVAKSVTAEASSSGGITIYKRGTLEQINTEKNSGGGITIK